MKKSIKVWALICVLVLAVAGLSACGGSNGSSEESVDGLYDETISISFTTWIGYAPFFVAKEKGIFEKNGVDVDLRVIESAADIKSALMAGQIQGYAQTPDTIIMGLAAGTDAVQVLNLDTSRGGDGIVCKQEFNSIEDLAGHTVAIDTSGGASLFYFNSLIRDLGLTMDDFDIQNMSAGDAGSAFVAGRVDAAVTWEPWLTNAKQTDFGKVLRSSDQDPGIICDSLGFTSEFIRDYPDSVQAIVDSWFEALDMINEEETHDECIEIMAESQGMTVDEFNATLPSVQYYDKEMNEDFVGGGGLQELCEKAAGIWYELGMVKEEIDCSNAVDKSFVMN